MNAFNWQGKPSIFTTNSRQQLFGADMATKWLATSLRRKAAPVSLSGGSVYPEPELMTRKKDALRTGGELGKRNKGVSK